MHGSPPPALGRGMLGFAAFLLVFGAWQAWHGLGLVAGLWLALAVTLACFGWLTDRPASRWDRVALVLGLVAGLVALGCAVVLSR